MVPFYCAGFTQWVGLDDWLVKVSWLGKLALVFWCMELDFFSLECNGVPSNEFLRWVYVLCVTLGRLYVYIQGYVPVLLENLHGMPCFKTYWLLGGGWFQYRYGGF